ncbi:MAG: nucleoside triphosphate pyrophosphohydrolase [Clostridia bacterium]|nr:nucleoside triphosphate pyrophosphohydrolase [Clostridia bacterium]
MVNYKIKEKYNIDDLLEIMAILRAPGGCPWDAEQTHESIKSNFIEETYEVIEAINQQNRELLLEELGDVLLQVVFHTEMEKEKGSFTFSDVADGICKKLIERHPHVFGDVKVSGTDEVLSNWDDIKRKSKAQKTQGSSMLKVPKELPALMRAQKIQSKAKKAGFDWDDMSGALTALESEIAELKQAIAAENRDDITDEFGDVLFSCVNVARFIDVDSEEALTQANEKFISRYLVVERLAEERGINMKETSIDELDKLWDEAKIILKSNRG